MSSLYYIKNAFVWGCLDVVWVGTESVWGCINTKSVGKQIILGDDTQILSFSPVPCIAYKCLCLGVSGLCLRVSGWGLSVSGDVLIPNLLENMYKSHASSDIAFSSSAL